MLPVSVTHVHRFHSAKVHQAQRGRESASPVGDVILGHRRRLSSASRLGRTGGWSVRSRNPVVRRGVRDLRFGLSSAPRLARAGVASGGGRANSELWNYAHGLSMAVATVCRRSTSGGFERTARGAGLRHTREARGG